MDNLKQIEWVADYHAKFERLAHSILLYSNAYDDVYFVSHFLGGLKEELELQLIYIGHKTWILLVLRLCCSRRRSKLLGTNLLPELTIRTLSNLVVWFLLPVTKAKSS